MEKIEEYKLPEPPADKTITTFFVGGVTEQDQKEELEKKFSDFGKV